MAQQMVNGFPRTMVLNTYSIAEAARLLSVPRTTLHDWTRPLSNGRGEWGPLVGRVPGYWALSFLSLVEGFMLSAVRAAGVAIPPVRSALESLREEIGLEYPLATRRLAADGAEILYEFGGDARTRRAVERLVEVREGRPRFRPVVDGFLQRLEYEGEHAYKMRLETPGAVVHYGIGSGRATFEARGCLVSTVLYRYDGGDTLADLVRDFGVPAEHIRAVVEQRPVWAEMRDRVMIRRDS